MKYINIDLFNLLIGFLGAIIGGFLTYSGAMKNVKASLESESLWRAKLMDVASASEVTLNDLLRLKASQRYKAEDGRSKSESIEVRDRIIDKTNSVYKKYILENTDYFNNKEKNKIRISPVDQIIIRTLAIALLKYDYIKREGADTEDEKNKKYKDLDKWLQEQIEILKKKAESRTEKFIEEKSFHKATKYIHIVFSKCVKHYKKDE